MHAPARDTGASPSNASIALSWSTHHFFLIVVSVLAIRMKTESI